MHLAMVSIDIKLGSLAKLKSRDEGKSAGIFHKLRHEEWLLKNFRKTVMWFMNISQLRRQLNNPFL